MSASPIEVPAEAFLLNQGLVSKHTEQRAAILTCLGCRILSNAAEGGELVTYGGEIKRCTGIGSGTVAPTLNALEQIGVLISAYEVENPATMGRPLRRLYGPAPTELGQAFQQTLTRPEHCPLMELLAARQTEDHELDLFLSAMIARRQDQMSASEMANAIGMSETRLLSLEHSGEFTFGVLNRYVTSLGLKLVLELKDDDIE